MSGRRARSHPHPDPTQKAAMSLLRTSFSAIAGVTALALLVPVSVVAQPPSTPAAIDRVVVNPGADAATAMSVTFRAAGVGASAGIEAEVELDPHYADPIRVPAGLVLSRAGGGAEPTFPPGPHPTAEHFSAHLGGLKPATTYRYRPVINGEPGEWAQFTTAHAQAEPFSFVYYGDAQNSLTTVWPKVAEHARRHSPDAALSVHAGDQINNADRDGEWHDYFAGMGGSPAHRPMIVAPGNHELTGDLFTHAHRAHFEFPDNGVPGLHDTTYFVDYQGVRFVTLHANYMRLTEQAMWLDRVLAENTQPWTVITFHQPVWNATTRRSDPLHRTAFQGVLENHDVDLALTGHDHAYGRGHAAGRPDGPVYVVSVAGGKYYEVDQHGNPWLSNGGDRVVGAGGLSTFQRVEVDGCRIDYTSIVGHASDEATLPMTEGDVLDSFVIDKCQGAKRVVDTR